MLSKRLWLLLVLPLSLWVSSCWADVPLTDEEYQRLTQIMTDLENINSEQEKILSEQKPQLIKLQQESNEQQMIISDLKRTTSEQKTLYEKERRSWKTRGAVSSIIAFGLGILLGIILV